MPFNALTNRFPRIEIPTACGITIPKIGTDDHAAQNSFRQADGCPAFIECFHKSTYFLCDDEMGLDECRGADSNVQMQYLPNE